MKPILQYLLLACLLPLRIQAQDITYSEHIAPIIYNNCTTCHRPGEVAPVSFTNYEEVSGLGSMIQYVTGIRYMPPWPPNREYSHFIGERYLTDEQIQMISDWVDDGMPQGDPALEPPLPIFSSGSQIGTPDMVLSMSESYTVTGNNTDDYRVFVLPTGFTEDREIASLEFRPGNNRAIHHVLFAYDVTGQAAARDALSPDIYGYESFGDFGVDATYLSWGYVPGALPLVYPEGIGQTIPAGADLLIQVHYAPLPTDEVDQSTVNIFFKDSEDEIEREVRQAMTLPEDLPGGWGSFYIPPNTTRTFTAIGADGGGAATIGLDVSLISVLPHAHYLGQNYEVYAVAPNGDTLKIIKIDDWDFNWQGAYTLDRMLRIPAGSLLYTTASYDNTTNNPFNPSIPPVGVGWGDGTNDEMLVVFYYYVPYQDGDEDIVIGENPISSVETASSTGSELLAPTPNPASGECFIPFNLTQKEQLRFELFNASGQRMRVLSPSQDWLAGEHRLPINAEDYPPGTYLIKMSGSGFALSQKLVIVR